MFLNVLGNVGTLGLVEELAGLLCLVPFEPGVLAVVEASECGCDDFERLGLLAHANDLTGLDGVGGYAYYSAIDDDVAVTDELTSCSACGCDAKAEDDVVQTAFEVLKENLTGDAVRAGSLVEHITELSLEHAIGVLGFLLLSKHDAVLRGLATTVVAMLSGREVALGQYLVGTENGLAEAAGNL